jgi:hypothetical protein
MTEWLNCFQMRRPSTDNDPSGHGDICDTEAKSPRTIVTSFNCHVEGIIVTIFAIEMRCPATPAYLFTAFGLLRGVRDFRGRRRPHSGFTATSREVLCSWDPCGTPDASILSHRHHLKVHDSLGFISCSAD